MSARITIARHEDEAELRELLRNNAMPGMIRLSYGREPNFFDSLSVMGACNQVVAARNKEGKIIGMGIRSIKSAYINGEVRQIGYLSNLRLEIGHRRRRYLAGGFKYLQELHQDGQCKFYLTSIMADNDIAQAILTHGRKLLPFYHPMGKVNTYLVSGSCQKCETRALQIGFVKESELTDIVDFLNSEGKNKQFFPYYAIDEIRSGTGLLRGLQYGDILVARDHHGVAATLALWNQISFRQILVDGYHPLLNLVRPAYNLYCKLRNYPGLVKAGAPVNLYYAALVCVRNNDKAIFDQVLMKASDYINGKNKALLALGLHEDDELSDCLKGFKYRLLQSNLYLVSYPTDKMDFSVLKKKVPYLELGAL